MPVLAITRKPKHTSPRPTNRPTNQPTNQRTDQPTNQPTKFIVQSLGQPTNQPTDRPINQRTNHYLAGHHIIIFSTTRRGPWHVRSLPPARSLCRSTKLLQGFCRHGCFLLQPVIVTVSRMYRCCERTRIVVVVVVVDSNGKLHRLLRGVVWWDRHVVPLRHRGRHEAATCVVCVCV